jgi:hypothetical protein
MQRDLVWAINILSDPGGNLNRGEKVARAMSMWVLTSSDEKIERQIFRNGNTTVNKTIYVFYHAMEISNIDRDKINWFGKMQWTVG